MIRFAKFLIKSTPSAEADAAAAAAATCTHACPFLLSHRHCSFRLALSPPLSDCHITHLLRSAADASLVMESWPHAALPHSLHPASPPRQQAFSHAQAAAEVSRPQHKPRIKVSCQCRHAAAQVALRDSLDLRASAGTGSFSKLWILKLNLFLFAPHGPCRGASLESATRRGSGRIWTPSTVIPAYPAPLSLQPAAAARAGA
jgi:hypothetical protein